LPAGEADQAHDFIDFGSDAFDDDRCLRGANLLKELGKDGFAPVFILGGRGLLFRFLQMRLHLG
jgi:hypothetical protein